MGVRVDKSNTAGYGVRGDCSNTATYECQS